MSGNQSYNKLNIGDCLGNPGDNGVAGPQFSFIDPDTEPSFPKFRG
jgi:hypothetical protein